MTGKNSFPANQFDLLRRALRCNKSELAAHLGVTAKTLREWEAHGPTTKGAERAALLFRVVTEHANCQHWQVDPRALAWENFTLKRG